MEVVAVIPCYREPVGEVARSLESALAVCDRVVIVDDGAQQADLDALARPRVAVIHRSENGGPSSALNDGVASTAPGSIICRLDVRDEFYAEPKRRQIAEVTGGMCRASASAHFDPVLGADRWVAPNWEQRIYRDCQFSTVTSVYERSVWEQVGGFDTSMRWCEDWVFSMKVQAAIGWRIFSEVTGTAGEFPGGHSDVTNDRKRRAARDADYALAHEYGLALANPDRFRHLFDPAWCARRGRKPLVRPK